MGGARKWRWAALLALAWAPFAQAQDPGEARFRALYKELVEINTTLSAGDCTRAARAMAARLTAGGIPAGDVQIVIPPGMPKMGNLVAALRGTDAGAKAILLLAHIDVVEADRADWARDPFTLVEESGYFTARGASDDKAMAAIFTDLLIRYREEGWRPKRTIKLALTCGEETPNHFDGARYLAENHRALIDAAFALNEGGGGLLDAQGQPYFLAVQAGEKIYQDYRLRVINPGGHSSRPVKDNAIYRLAAALEKIAAYDFPIAVNEAVRGYYAAMAKIDRAPDLAAAAKANPDPAVLARLAADPARNAMMRTTCVATQLSAGHAPNALPQNAEANVNCRILPGVAQEAVRQQLIAVIADAQVAVSFVDPPEKTGPPPPLTSAILTPVRAAADSLWPGLPIAPVMTTGATDARFLTPAGIPTYGISGLLSDADGGGTHGLNERIRVKTVLDGRTFLYRLVKLYSGGS
ncbi:MAG: M20/M25/M40 family metallo-hydrolase [Hyphomonadaceae bacterium]